MKFICVTEAKTVFSIDVRHVTNTEALNKYMGRRDTPPETLLQAAWSDPDGINWPESIAYAKRQANGCAVYTEEQYERILFEERQRKLRAQQVADAPELAIAA